MKSFLIMRGSEKICNVTFFPWWLFQIRDEIIFYIILFICAVFHSVFSSFNIHVWSKEWILLGRLLAEIACDTCMTHVSLSRPIKKTNCAMCNLCIATDIEAAEPRNRRSTWKLSRSMSTLSWNIIFLPQLPFTRHFFALFSLSLSTPFPLLFEWVNHSQFPDARCPYRPFASFCFTRSENEQKFAGDAVEYRSRSTYFISKLKIYVDLRVYIDAARTGIWADLAADRDWKEHRFSAITGFEPHLCPFIYFRDEYFLTVAFDSTI